MEEYAHRKNIERFERDLQRETDPGRHAILSEILAAERLRLEVLLRQDPDRREGGRPDPGGAGSGSTPPSSTGDG